jgi:hypothetical protein
MPDRDDDEKPLTRQQIEHQQNELAKLSEPTVLESLRASYINCAPKDGKLPSPRAVQGFLSVWKVLWRWKQNAKPAKPPKVHDVKDESPR